MRLAAALAICLCCFSQTREEWVAAAANALQEQLIAQRRDFHSHPELSNREERSARVIAEKLRALRFDEVKTGVGKHGVVAVLKGGKPGPVVAWRADMDALPVFSNLDKPYKSQNNGVHHACGHDAHMAIGLAVAEVLAGMRDQIPGTVKFIFQPAEEGAPRGEEGGASLMIKEGALENPRPAAIFGLHVFTPYPAGTVGYTAGPAMASANAFSISIKGKQVHAAMPHMGIDAISVAAQCITQLQTIRSRRIDPNEGMVLSIGSIHGGNRSNIITGEVRMEGTIRTFSENTREAVRGMMRRTLAGCTAAGDASFTLDFDGVSYPVTVNNAALTSESLPQMRRVLGDANIIATPPVTGAEDFAYYQRVIPGFFWFLGARNEKLGITGAHHTPEFDIDESILVPGVKLAANQLLDYLERHR
ncbi:MAG TPA: amidohydrolase [Bryobacteraceae bacterium]|nr:amidohydrolase [Bryobacteraceae bacterium]